jgi:hypothetical protein
MPRRTLIAVVIALCSGAAQAPAQAQYAGGSVPAGASEASTMSAPSMPSTSTGSTPDIRSISPAQPGIGCDRLKNENLLGSGGLMGEDVKAKAEYCKWASGISRPE